MHLNDLCGEWQALCHRAVVHRCIDERFCNVHFVWVRQCIYKCVCVLKRCLLHVWQYMCQVLNVFACTHCACVFVCCSCLEEMGSNKSFEGLLQADTSKCKWRRQPFSVQDSTLWCILTDCVGVRGSACVCGAPAAIKFKHAHHVFVHIFIFLHRIILVKLTLD